MHSFSFSFVIFIFNIYIYVYFSIGHFLYFLYLASVLVLLSPSCLPLSFLLDLKTLMEKPAGWKTPPPPTSIFSVFLPSPHSFIFLPLFLRLLSSPCLPPTPLSPLQLLCTSSFFHSEIHHLGKREKKKRYKTK